MSKAADDREKEVEELYRFEAGSYGDAGAFMPSLACLKQIGEDEWKYHFVLVKPESVHFEESRATAEAENDISEAYQVKSIGGSDVDLAMALKKKGYFSVDNFNIVGSKEFQA